MRRQAEAAGRTRSCPHCRVTILESAAVCPACKHHLRFEPNRPDQNAVAGEVAFKVAGQFYCQPAGGPREYSVVVTIRDSRGKDLARHVVSVGGLAAGEERDIELTVEMFRPPG